ncbi:zona pellucida sperm-binding protein 3 [Xenopus tropicalis]|uniref:Zona pellucida sperm-binding protein 3 n=2 Tax=Xenopus tropicalis TaxID=8364 RepID=A0A8J0QHY9_XENTR|nr:zona pellucida sperm-binding protein 3 [Xenopus tropicalis]
MGIWESLAAAFWVVLVCEAMLTSCRHFGDPHLWKWDPHRKHPPPVQYFGGFGGHRRDLQPPQLYPIGVQCGEAQITVTVQKDLFRNGRMVKASDLSLGPQGCTPSSQGPDTVTFQYGLQECGNRLQLSIKGFWCWEVCLVTMGIWESLAAAFWVVLVCEAMLTSCRHSNDPNYHWKWDPHRKHPPPVQFFGGYGGYRRDLQPPQLYPIRVQCGEAQITVTVQKDLFRNGRMVKASDLSLGPQGCTPSSQGPDTVTFQYGLQECGNRLQMTSNWLIYSTNLTHSPTPSRNSPIIRTNSATVPIQCYYPRNANVSSKAIKPTWVPYSSTLSMEERLSFSLKLMTDDWLSPRTSSIFHLGDIFSIEASVDTRNYGPMVIFVDRCVATQSPDMNSSPQYEIIAQNGCLVDSKQEDSSSTFWSPRPSPDKLRFKVDAFKFIGAGSSVIYITCSLRVAAADQGPDALNKACSFSKASNMWSALNGPNNICGCCDTGGCAPTGSRGVNGFRRLSRSVESSSKVELVAVGPLSIIDPESHVAPSETEDSDHLVELWLLVALCCLSLIVISVCVIVNIQRFCKKQSRFVLAK